MRKRRTLGKVYGIKVWEHIGEHVENLGNPLETKKILKIFLSPQPKFGVPRVEIGPIESTLHVIDFCVLFRHYYKQDAKYSLMNFVFGQSKTIFWGKVSKVIKLFSCKMGLATSKTIRWDLTSDGRLNGPFCYCHLSTNYLTGLVMGLVLFPFICNTSSVLEMVQSSVCNLAKKIQKLQCFNR
jgi:hypothetical protein